MTPKLLSLNTYYYRRGGADAVFFDHDRLFQQLGWETAMFAMRHNQNEPSPWSEYFIDELEFGHSYSLMQQIAMAGKVIYSLEARRKLARLLDRFQPDIVHSHCIYHHISPSVLPLLKERGIPVVMTAHDLKLACPAYKMLNRKGICEKCRGGNLLPVIANRCVRDSLAVSALVAVESMAHRLFGLYRHYLDRVVTPSLFFRVKLMEWGWPQEKLVYIPNFIHADNFTPQFKPGSYFFYFGRLAPEKGIKTLIKAAQQTKVALKIAGTGPEEDSLKTLADGHNNIEFLGHCGGERLWSLVRGARAVILPSEWYENAPMSVLEACACGKPSIGARIGGIPELIREEETGLLFESGNSADLASCLERIACQPDSDLMTMGRAAREYVLTHFNERHYGHSMLDLYASLGVPVGNASSAGISARFS